MLVNKEDYNTRTAYLCAMRLPGMSYFSITLVYTEQDKVRLWRLWDKAGTVDFYFEEILVAVIT